MKRYTEYLEFEVIENVIRVGLNTRIRQLIGPVVNVDSFSIEDVCASEIRLTASGMYGTVSVPCPIKGTILRSNFRTNATWFIEVCADDDVLCTFPKEIPSIAQQ